MIRLTYHYCSFDSFSFISNYCYFSYSLFARVDFIGIIFGLLKMGVNYLSSWMMNKGRSVPSILIVLFFTYIYYNSQSNLHYQNPFILSQFWLPTLSTPFLTLPITYYNGVFCHNCRVVIPLSFLKLTFKPLHSRNQGNTFDQLRSELQKEGLVLIIAYDRSLLALDGAGVYQIGFKGLVLKILNLQGVDLIQPLVCILFRIFSLWVKLQSQQNFIFCSLQQLHRCSPLQEPQRDDFMHVVHVVHFQFGILITDYQITLIDALNQCWDPEIRIQICYLINSFFVLFLIMIQLINISKFVCGYNSVFYPQTEICYLLRKTTLIYQFE